MNRIKHLFVVLFLLACACVPVASQDIKFERQRHKQILKMLFEDLKNNYFDPKFKGIDIEAKYKEAAARMESANSVGEMQGIAAGFLDEMDDSHVFFAPPSKRNKSEYGFRFRMVGDKCFVFGIDKDSNAEKSGLRVGDQIAGLQGYAVTRDTLHKMRYLFFILRPQPAIQLKVVKPNGDLTDIVVPAKVTAGRAIRDLTESGELNNYIREAESSYYQSRKQYFYTGVESVLIWRMPEFNLSPEDVDKVMERAKGKTAMIIDLRDNGGGRVDMLLRLIGNVFDRKVKVGDEKKRKETKEITAKSRAGDAFKGEIIVLVDSGSGSASEVFSRVIQLEKRGKIVGDRTAGAVMESMFFPREIGLDIIVPFGSSITIADLIMTDGKSLERIGVTPDAIVLPTGKDLASKHDPVMAKGLSLLGVRMTPEDAGKIFPQDLPND